MKYKKNWGPPREHIALGIKVAKTLGSPVFRVIQGTGEDRRTPGGIEARINDMVAVLKENRGQILDGGIKISVENHAGDMQSRELVRLIEEAGPDIVGVNIDSGNHAWTLEDPLEGLSILGKYVNCSSLRDEQIWETKEGAMVQWTPIGEGVIDWPAYIKKWQELCPTVPIQIETISGFSRAFPYFKPEFWETFPNARARISQSLWRWQRRGMPWSRFRRRREWIKRRLSRSIRRISWRVRSSTAGRRWGSGCGVRLDGSAPLLAEVAKAGGSPEWPASAAWTMFTISRAVT